MKQLFNKLANLIKTAANKVIAAISTIQSDKVEHFAVGSILAAFGLLVPLFCGVPAWACLIISAVLVIGTEYYKETALDSKPDPWDVVATVAGALIVWLTVLAVLTSIYS